MSDKVNYIFEDEGVSSERLEEMYALASAGEISLSEVLDAIGAIPELEDDIEGQRELYNRIADSHVEGVSPTESSFDTMINLLDNRHLISGGRRPSMSDLGRILSPLDSLPETPHIAYGLRSEHDEEVASTESSIDDYEYQLRHEASDHVALSGLDAHYNNGSPWASSTECDSLSGDETVVDGMILRFICPSCGREGSLRLIDEFGLDWESMIDHLHCRCGSHVERV